MRRLNTVVLSIIVSFALPGIALAANDDPLAKYNNMIKQSLSQPVTGELQKPNTDANRAISSGQAALRPAPPAAPVIPNQVMPAQNNVPAQQQYPSYSTTTNSTNSANTQQQAPAGPPNIFVTPGGNSTDTNKGNAIIHY